MALPQDFIDELMKGKCTWGESPTHVWDNDVQPEIHKLTALYALIDYGADELLRAGLNGDYPESITRGVVDILGDTLHALKKFREMLPKKVEALVWENLEKALCEGGLEVHND